MSAAEDAPDTLAVLTEAIRVHVAAEGGAYMTDFVLIAAAARPDDPDSTDYTIATSNAPLHTRLGLVRYLERRTDKLMSS